jgi:hypothetical protein
MGLLSSLAPHIQLITTNGVIELRGTISGECARPIERFRASLLENAKALDLADYSR